VIQPPRRSVTRFFIPMIDVLTLLFCIFLLMPFVKAGAEGGDGDAAAGPPVGTEPEPKGDAADLARRLDAAQRELERLRKEKSDALQRLEVRTLEIDGKTGDLIYYAPEPVKIATQSDAVRLINGHREELRRAGGRDLYYLFLYPHDPAAPFPTQKQMNTYTRWVEGVPFGIDNPQARR
jgi:hypothetical protein